MVWSYYDEITLFDTWHGDMEQEEIDIGEEKKLIQIKIDNIHP